MTHYVCIVVCYVFVCLKTDMCLSFRRKREETTYDICAAVCSRSTDFFCDFQWLFSDVRLHLARDAICIYIYIYIYIYMKIYIYVYIYTYIYYSMSPLSHFFLWNTFLISLFWRLFSIYSLFYSLAYRITFLHFFPPPLSHIMNVRECYLCVCVCVWLCMCVCVCVCAWRLKKKKSKIIKKHKNNNNKKNIF